jgi:hypothetical protein
MDSNIITALISGGVTIVVLLGSKLVNHYTRKAQFTVNDGAALREDLMNERKGLVDEIEALRARCSHLELECITMKTENLRLTNEVIRLEKLCAELIGAK